MNKPLGPNFILIGASRCATTSMARLLRAHPDIFVTNPKELYFFSHDRKYEKGWNSYSRYFTESERFAARGEATTDYANVKKYPWVSARIAEIIPRCRLIFMVRNPLDRIESQWNLFRSINNKNISIYEAITNYPEFIQMSSYNETLNSYLMHFNREQLLIIFFEEFVKNPSAHARLCYAHLGVDSRADITSAPRAPNRSLTMRRQRPFIKALRKQRMLMELYRGIFPCEIRDHLVRDFFGSLGAGRSWDKQSLEYVHQHLRKDTEKFLEVTGKPKSYWDLDRKV